MTRRSAMQTLLGAPLGFPAILRGARRPAGDKPNLLFILTDQHRADSMAVYGNYTYKVPAMNRLASESIVFDRCYVTQPICTPSRASLMTGQWPHTHRSIDNNVPLRKESPTLPEMLNDSAYRTGYFGKWHLGDEFFAQRGFQEWVTIEDGYNEHFSPERDRNKRSDYHDFLLNVGYEPDDEGQRFSREFAVRRPLEHTKSAFLATRASDFIVRNRNEPWMLCVGFLEPHRPYHGPLNDLHSAEEAPVPRNYPGLPVEREPKNYRLVRDANFSKGYDRKDPVQVQRLNRNYAGLCAQVDHALNQILWALEVSGQADNTIVVLTSDHGEMMGSHSLFAKFVMYEESIRVPLFIRVPFRQSSLVKINQPVSNVNVAPTLLELMGRKPPESAQGESLLPLVEGRSLPDDHVYIESHSPPDGPNGRTVISPEGWKVALYDRDNCLLFHRERDPLEMDNLYYRSDSKKVIADLQRKLETWQRRVGDEMTLRPSTS